ncbi:hypothetical protein FQA39_LY09310 [Lamprigera yunnana]|nr:hypothetical protein FQA39_LY09310 [Lamprigera yunnana]
MSLEVVNFKRKKPNEQFCLFCDNSSDLVKNPRPGTLLHIKEAANRRKDSISEKFSKLYDPDCTKQEFSWHQDCLATYISEEKIRRREIALYKEEEEVSASTSKANVEELTPKSRSSSRTPAALKKSFKCIFCTSTSVPGIKTVIRCKLAYRLYETLLLELRKVHILNPTTVTQENIIQENLHKTIVEIFMHTKSIIEIYIRD